MQEKDIFTIIVPLKETGENGTDETNDTLNETNDTLNEPLKPGITSDCGKHREQIILLVWENPEITQEQLAQALKVSLSTVKREMKLLQNKGEILREDAKKAGKWIVEIK